VVAADVVYVLLLLQFVQPILLGSDDGLLGRTSSCVVSLWVRPEVALCLRWRHHHLLWWMWVRGRSLLLLLLSQMQLLQLGLLWHPLIEIEAHWCPQLRPTTPKGLPLQVLIVLRLDNNFSRLVAR
jgi:hypothetical protein